MSTPLSTEDKKGMAELDKLNLEIDLLRRERKFFWLKSPVLTTVVAAAGLFLTAWQFQRTENARIDERLIGFENQKQERKAKIHAEIRSDRAQLTEFEIDPKFTAARARFLIDDLRELVARDELKNDRLHLEDNIGEDLRAMVWRLPFDQRRHFDFDVSTLRRWSNNRVFWTRNPSSHGSFLTKKYYPVIQNQKSCFERLGYKGEEINYPEGCDRDLMGALIYGFEEHLKVAKENSDAVLQEQVQSFVTASNNEGFGAEVLNRLRRGKSL